MEVLQSMQATTLEAWTVLQLMVATRVLVLTFHEPHQRWERSMKVHSTLRARRSPMSPASPAEVAQEAAMAALVEQHALMAPAEMARLPASTPSTHLSVDWVAQEAAMALEGTPESVAAVTLLEPAVASEEMVVRLLQAEQQAAG
jgi:hypothetical protein